MSPVCFHVTEHIIDAQHIREYPAATAAEDVKLKLHIKQYTPKITKQLWPDAITIVGAHANAFPKELYEPLWDDLYQQISKYNIDIRSIWIADVAHQGQSSIINEKALGNDPSWYDHARDLLHMVNHFRDEMPRPLIGIGHSMGGNQIVNLSLMHPRLFVSLVLIDPVIEQGLSVNPEIGKRPTTDFGVATASTHRRDIWPSRKEAAEAFTKNAFYRKWDKRVLDLWIEFGLRDIPTALYPTNTTGEQQPVTLATTKHQEVWTFLRPNYDGYEVGVHPRHNRSTHPDIDPSSPAIYPFYRPESRATFKRLPALRPPVLFIMGELSTVSNGTAQRDKVKVTGTGVGGSGGSTEGKVKDIVLPGIGHLIPMEATGTTAVETALWLNQVLQRWRVEEEALRKSRGDAENLKVDESWLEHIGGSKERRFQKL